MAGNMPRSKKIHIYQEKYDSPETALNRELSTLIHAIKILIKTFGVDDFTYSDYKDYCFTQDYGNKTVSLVSEMTLKKLIVRGWVEKPKRNSYKVKEEIYLTVLNLASNYHGFFDNVPNGYLAEKIRDYVNDQCKLELRNEFAHTAEVLEAVRGRRWNK